MDWPWSKTKQLEFDGMLSESEFGWDDIISIFYVSTLTEKVFTDEIYDYDEGLCNHMVVVWYLWLVLYIHVFLQNVHLEFLSYIIIIACCFIMWDDLICLYVGGQK